MAAAGRGDEIAISIGGEQLRASELLACAWGGARACTSASTSASAIAYVGTNGLAFPIALFASAAAGVPFVPMNYRLSDAQLHELLEPLGAPLVIADGAIGDALAARGHRVVATDAFVAA